MSDCCRLNRGLAPHAVTRPSVAGFTLIEILVVTVIIGLIAAVALPGLYKIARSVEEANQRENLLSDISTLGYRAYSSGRPLVLGGADSDPQNYVPVVPEGWMLVIPKPIHYGFNGICSGGSITLVAPNHRSEDIPMHPPFCRIGEPGPAA